MRLFLIAAVAVFFSGAANATTLTFDRMNYTPIVENDYTYINFSSYNIGGWIYLHDDGGQRSVSITRVDGQTFNPVSASIYGYSKIYTTGSQERIDAILANNGYYYTDPWATSAKPVYDNFTVEGIRNGQVVAYTTGYASGASTYSFGSNFNGIDELRVSLKLPDFAYVRKYYVPMTPYTNYCEQWCAGFRMYDLTLDDTISAVPLPASGVLLGFGLLGFGFLKRRKS